MKNFTQITESAYIRSITSAANKFIDTRIPQDLSALYQFLSPQWVAAYTGLKKLVEKDYQEDEAVFPASITTALIGS
jgi:hypothetical protein